MSVRSTACLSFSLFALQPIPVLVCLYISVCLPAWICLCRYVWMSVSLSTFTMFVYVVFFMFIYKRKRVILPKYDPWTFFRNTEKIKQVTFLNLIFSETELQRSVWVIEMCLLLLMLFELFALKQPFADILQNTYS